MYKCTMQLKEIGNNFLIGSPSKKEEKAATWRSAMESDGFVLTDQ